jgi:hypothetical protein
LRIAFVRCYHGTSRWLDVTQVLIDPDDRNAFLRLGTPEKSNSALLADDECAAIGRKKRMTFEQLHDPPIIPRFKSLLGQIDVSDVPIQPGQVGLN